MHKSQTYEIMHISRLLRDYGKKHEREIFYAVKTTDAEHVIIIILKNIFSFVLRKTLLLYSV